MDQGDDEWTPPTEAELKIMAAKRERSNKISQLMGSYLLKGYKMLATTCPSCGTILMRSKDGDDYCVACSELSTDVSKDDPAVSNAAAQSQAAEGNLRTSVHDEEMEEQPTRLFTCSTSRVSPPATARARVPPVPMAADSPISRITSSEAPTITEQSLTNSIETVQAKLQWATHQLQGCENPEACIQWCKVVQQCADSMLSLYTLKCQIRNTEL